MKLNLLETHDRLDHFKNDQAINIFQGAEDCLKKNTLSLMLQDHADYIYLFAHPRTGDDGVTKVMYWQPRLTKPKAQTNSYLFRAQSKSDLIEVIWLLPPREMWAQYEIGKVTQSDLVMQSITDFEKHREALERPNHEDLSDERIFKIYQQIDKEMKKIKKFEPL